MNEQILLSMVEYIRNEILELHNLSDEESFEREQAGELYDAIGYILNALNVEYTFNVKKRLVGITAHFAIGAPKIWLDTKRQAIFGAWGNTEVSVYLDSDICELVESYCETVVRYH